MEALPIIMAVYTLAQGINLWLESRAEKEVVIRRIAGTVAQIQHVLLPLHENDQAIYIEPQTLGIVKGIGGTLKMTQEHLLVWQDRPPRRILAVLSPSSMTKQLKEDERQLNQQLFFLIASITVVGFVEKRRRYQHHLVPSSGAVLQVTSAATSSTVLGSIMNKEVREFWSGYVGAELPYISGDEFCTRMEAWLGEVLNASARRQILLRLDEFAIGGITPAALQSVVGIGGLRSFVDTYVRAHSSPPSNPSLRKKGWWFMKPKTQRVALPLLVWIDDNPVGNARIVESARRGGINVIQLKSTAVAKRWVDSHSDFLRYNDHPSKVRFISDNHRNELSAIKYLNISAGENILRYLRGRKYNAPVLIYCGKSIGETTYVTDYTLAGSTTSFYVAMEYVESLAEKKSDDTGWVGFQST